MTDRMGRVLVYGDVMLDVLVTGDVRRMSPEAPDAPVLTLREFGCMAGGAANVAVCVAAMGGAATLIGTVGADSFGEQVRAVLNQTPVAVTLMGREHPTTTKVRLMTAAQQLMRVDIEQPEPVKGEEEDSLLQRAVAAARETDVAVISDYAKGAVTPLIATKLIEVATARRIATVVDSKTPAAEHFHGATIIKPNLAEIATALGRPEPKTDREAAVAAQALRRKTNAACVVLTRGGQGVTLAGEPGEMHFDPYPVTPVDVTGAGDAVAAGLALALASKSGIVEAVRFANAAGAASICKLGTASPSFDEVEFFYDCRSWRHQAAGDDVAADGLHGRLN